MKSSLPEADRHDQIVTQWDDYHSEIPFDHLKQNINSERHTQKPILMGRFFSGIVSV